MNYFALKEYAPGYCSTIYCSWVTCGVFSILTGESVAGFQVIAFAFRSTYDDCIRFAKARRRLDQCVQYRLEIERRPADDLEDVGGRGLLLKKFTQLVEQPRILDRDDGLGGKILN